MATLILLAWAVTAVTILLAGLVLAPFVLIYRAWKRRDA